MKITHIALASALTIVLSGCGTMESTSKGAGSTGTGVIGGAIAGAGAGVLCDKLLGGSNAACIAAGMAVGALAGKLLADLDDEWSKSVPVSRCADVQAKLGYQPNETAPRGAISVAFEPASAIIKPGASIKPTVKVDLAAPEGQAISTKLRVNDSISERVIKKECGGDYTLPLEAITAEQAGAQYLEVALINADTNTEIASTKVCYSVSATGKSLCDAAPAPTPEKKVKGKGKGKGKGGAKKRK